METPTTALDYTTSLLLRMTLALEKIANNGHPSAPDLVRPLTEYKTFEWASIGASILQSDPHGPTHIEYEGQIYTRRSPQNKYGSAIWFSRSCGKDAEGNTLYLRLITFREISEADPLPAKIAQAATSNGNQPPTNGSTPPPPPQPQPTRLTAPQYYAQATRLNISLQAADAIAEIVSGDIEAAYKLLDYFGKAKSAGMVFSNAQKLLQAHNGDPVRAGAAIKLSSV